MKDAMCDGCYSAISSVAGAHPRLYLGMVPDGACNGEMATDGKLKGHGARSVRNPLLAIKAAIAEALDMFKFAKQRCLNE